MAYRYVVVLVGAASEEQVAAHQVPHLAPRRGVYATTEGAPSRRCTGEGGKGKRG